MSQLVPYALAAAPYAARFAKRQRLAKTAVGLGQFAWNNRATIKAAASMFRKNRAMRGKARIRAQKRRATISEPYETNEKGSFHTGFVPGPGAHSNATFKTLYFDAMSMPSQGLGTTERLTEQIYLKGINICMSVFNNQGYPIEVHMALLNLESDADSTGDELRNNFFRADDVGDRTTLDFQNFTENSNWDIRYLCNPISPDNKRILWHEKRVLSRVHISGTHEEVNDTYFTKLDRYVKINRTIQLNNNTSGVGERPFAWCIWALPVNDINMPASTGTHFRYLTKFKMYFKNKT